MKRFVVPPNWPTPPRRSWVPPKTWRPDPAWPPAPEDWKFWVDGKGNPVRGPVGRYGGPSRRAVVAGAGGLVLFLAVNLWAVSALGLFDGETPRTQAAPILDDRSPTPSLTPTPTVTPPKVRPSTPPPTPRTTPTPTARPTKTRTAPRPQRTEAEEPAPTRTVTKTVRPPRPTASTTRPPTREEILQEYCRQRGWDYDFCDPDNWPDDPEETGR